MQIFEPFYPDYEMDSAFDIPYERLFEEGYRGILFDIDNTLVPHGAPADKKSERLFDRLNKIGFKTVVLSNNKKPRVESFALKVNSRYIYKAGKPGKKGYLKSMVMIETDADNTLFIGDQLFTDIWGAKRCGIKTILTKPIHPKEEIQIVLKRRLEAVVLFFYHHSKNYRNNKGLLS